MDSRKLKRILLLILLLLNVFLLAVVLSDSAQTRRSNAETAASVAALLEENGIRAADGAIRISQAPAKCTLTRDLAQEQRIVKGLIGRNESTDQGGNIMYYAGARGQAQMRGSGELDVLFQSGAVPVNHGEERTGLRLLKNAGIHAGAARRDTSEGMTWEFFSRWNGIPVYNAVLRVSFTESDVSIMTGTRIFDTVTTQDGSGLMDSVSVLIRFMEIVRNEGYICSRIDAVEPGYLQSVLRSGEMLLTPVWRIETDAGAILIDAESGRLENRLS